MLCYFIVASLLICIVFDFTFSHCVALLCFVLGSVNPSGGYERRMNLQAHWD